MILTTRDKEKISCTIYNQGHKELVIIAHGFFNSQESELLLKLKNGLLSDFDVLMFDFRGHGKSSGLFSWTVKEGLDLEAVLDYAGGKYKTIGLVGFSFGAAIGINVLAGTDRVSSMVSVSAPSECGKIDYRFWNLDLDNDIVYNLGEGRTGKGVRPGPFWLKKIKPLDSAGKLRCPVLYIHGDKDWVIGHEHSRRLYEATTSKKKIEIIKNGPHAEYLMRKDAGQLVKLIKQWFNQTLSEKEMK